jgi:hypothetical protein
MSRVEEITEKLIEMMAAESEWVKTGIELEEVHSGIRRVAEGVAPHVVRLLAQERENTLYEVRRQIVGARNIHGFEQAKRVLTIQDAASLLSWVDRRLEDLK